eukprot:15465354-Alexandrium_andersonii.AAC.1
MHPGQPMHLLTTSQPQSRQQQQQLQQLLVNVSVFDQLARGGFVQARTASGCSGRVLVFASDSEEAPELA